MSSISGEPSAKSRYSPLPLLALIVSILLSVLTGNSYSSSGSKKAKTEVTMALDKAVSEEESKENGEAIASREGGQTEKNELANKLQTALANLQLNPPQGDKKKKLPLETMGHGLVPIRTDSTSVLDVACSVCTNGLNEREICQLSCKHSFCTPCIDKISTLSASDPICPSCRKVTMRKDLVKFQKPEDFYQKFPMKCTQRGCLWGSSLLELKVLGEDAHCPFPAKVLLGLPKTGFPGGHTYTVLRWLQNKFEKMGYNVCNVSYCLKPDSDQVQQARCLTAPSSSTSSPLTQQWTLLQTGYQEESEQKQMVEYFKIQLARVNLKPHVLYYPLKKTSMETNEEHFLQNSLLDLVIDIGLDMFIYDFMQVYPKAFDQESDTYIHTYKREDDTLTVINNKEYKTLILSTVYNPMKQTFDFDALRGAMELQGIDYYKLFPNSPPTGKIHFDEIHESALRIIRARELAPSQSYSTPRSE